MTALRYLGWLAAIAALCLLTIPTLVFALLADIGEVLTGRLADAAEAVRP